MSPPTCETVEGKISTCTDSPESQTTTVSKATSTTVPSSDNDGGGFAPSRTPSTPRVSTKPSSTVETTNIASIETGSAGGSFKSTTSPSPISKSGTSDGVSKGAVAGIAIATLIIGAAIASLVAFLFYKRRKRSSRHPYSESIPDLVASQNGKHMPYVQISQTPAPVIAAAVAPVKRDLDLTNLSNSSDFLSGVLLPAADEQTVRVAVARLFDKIQRHVDSYYRDAHATITPTMERDLTRFGSESINVVEMLQNLSMPTVAIKHALVSYILSIVSPEAEDQATLFPTEISGLKENERSTVSPGDQAAYIIYKRLAVHLHSPNSTSLESRQSDIREAAEHFSLTFFPWANPAYNDNDKDEDLIRAINSALETSVWLYGQPFCYEFVWEAVGRRGITIAPGLVRTTDTMGRICERPKLLIEPVVTAG